MTRAVMSSPRSPEKVVRVRVRFRGERRTTTGRKPMPFALDLSPHPRPAHHSNVPQAVSCACQATSTAGSCSSAADASGARASANGEEPPHDEVHALRSRSPRSSRPAHHRACRSPAGPAAVDGARSCTVDGGRSSRQVAVTTAGDGGRDDSSIEATASPILCQKRTPRRTEREAQNRDRDGE